MIVMPANNRKGIVHFWAGRYGAVGHLHSPGPTPSVYPWIPYALDNGAFGAWAEGRPFDAVAYSGLLNWVAFAKQAPLWCLVPDVVADREATLRSWAMWAPIVRQASSAPLAFAVQDGMTPADVPDEVDVIFVGGSTKPGSCKGWKWDSLAMWCRAFDRVHVGRVNGYAGLVRCAELGVESCDGTGWFKGDAKQLAGLAQFLEEQDARDTSEAGMARDAAGTSVRSSVPPHEWPMDARGARPSWRDASSAPASLMDFDGL